MFLLSFWYIICIFLIWNERVKNFMSSNHFLKFLNNREISFIPNLELTLDIDTWGHKPGHLPHWQDRVKPSDWVKDDIINGNSSQIIYGFEDSMLKGLWETWVQMRRPGRTIWWWHRWLLVTGVAPMTLPNSGDWWSTAWVSYGDSYNTIRCSGAVDSHLDDSKVFVEGNNGQRRPWLRWFCGWPAKGNGWFLVIEEEFVQFLWPGCIPHRDRSLELHGGASDGL
jgi:hypothetical protein